MKTLYEHADDIALGYEFEKDHWRLGPGCHKVIAVYPSYDQLERETADYPERDDIHFTVYGAPLLGRRTANIVAYRGDFLEAFSNPLTHDDLTAAREQNMRHLWVTQMLMCRLLPGGRIILV